MWWSSPWTHSSSLKRFALNTSKDTRQYCSQLGPALTQGWWRGGWGWRCLRRTRTFPRSMADLSNYLFTRSGREGEIIDTRAFGLRTFFQLLWEITNTTNKNIRFRVSESEVSGGRGWKLVVAENMGWVAEGVRRQNISQAKPVSSPVVVEVTIFS